MRTSMKLTTAATLVFLSACSGGENASESNSQEALSAAINSEHRTEAYVERDNARHPLETLTFFEIQPDMTVVEIWPGGGWYTEILAPYLKDDGQFYAAHFDPNHEREYYSNSRANFEEKMAGSDVYSNVTISTFVPGSDYEIAPAGSADRVLSFRNMHNWYMGGGEEGLNQAFQAFYTALKPGGILGIVDHRLPEHRADSEMEGSGYMKASWAIAFAEAAGFEFVGESDVNSNDLDSANYERGVWTLPPTLALGETNRDLYIGIGESDRFTLKFRKPEE
ncbi:MULTISPECIES: class I SAM-dependent methyltransferase [Gammaproteobacteria]|uniref:class I SAM-dependent methyltransferase n=1 Tax=Gammaproteobacteria TaxID=1236 RepID=UPI000DD0A400|nr:MULTISPECIES: class I SAM-dependent methyltransferase [Gammaproteobacteria]RTE85697.1 methyltransferase [Aliidiomarina sp. B3213]TCZ90302.1 methyltransferase [Lysobacter sp. N42]